ncbi:transglycosylase SLT domain-containing protein [Kiloniella laminariae]|uniref:transglycosylase SLT domain-containing protein n=1 Tax=Kiloniella laminariae TaxID=454162 RepID=UPI001B7FDD68|nr:transglycosylase SLT domain-containing protein [Kiloniella laminariae]
MSSSWAASLYTDKYDKQIAFAVSAHWPDYPYPEAWKAQLYQESLLEPLARSPVGAEGLAQFMPGTWAQISKELGYGLISPRLADPAINAGAYYMKKLRRSWISKRPEEDRHKLAQASYNAGLGNIIKAQRLCGGVLLYLEIVACLSQVTGKHSRETITYVERIEIWRAKLKGGR